MPPRLADTVDRDGRIARWEPWSDIAAAQAALRA